jgi:divalent metal cation (Fe/Co/Zn/Cd) transporter
MIGRHSSGKSTGADSVMVRVMRHLMNLIVSVGLIYAGVYVLYEELFVSYSGIHGRYQPFGIGLILFGSGVVWLWWYLVGPIVLKRLTREEPPNALWT